MTLVDRDFFLSRLEHPGNLIDLVFAQTVLRMHLLEHDAPESWYVHSPPHPHKRDLTLSWDPLNSKEYTSGFPHVIQGRCYTFFLGWAREGCNKKKVSIFFPKSVTLI